MSDKAKASRLVFERLASDGDAMRAVFEHFRNVAITASVFGAALWVFEHPARNQLVYLSYASVVVLFAIGLFLFVLNELHAHRRMAQAGLPAWVEITARITYTFGMLAFLISLTNAR